MPEEQAYKACALWWADKFVNGREWDSIYIPRPKATIEQLQPIFEELCTKSGVHGLHCDNGNYDIDDALKSAGFQFSSLIHGPSKSGTRLFRNTDGSFTPVAAGGYRQPWTPIDKNGQIIEGSN